jgi:hypothetical protein
MNQRSQECKRESMQESKGMPKARVGGLGSGNGNPHESQGS